MKRTTRSGRSCSASSRPLACSYWPLSFVLRVRPACRCPLPLCPTPLLASILIRFGISRNILALKLCSLALQEALRPPPPGVTSHVTSPDG